MRIATWNINGVKARLDNLLRWLEEDQPDIACLQEIKSVDEAFPRGEIEALGYHVETHGQKTFNGVAILSKRSPDEVVRGLPVVDGLDGNFGAADEQARFIEAVYSTKETGRKGGGGEAGVIRVANLYLPNGNPVTVEGEGESTTSEKYAYKLNWMDRLIHHAKGRLAWEEPFIMAGDYNVIPAPRDAAKIEMWQNDALFLPATRLRFQELINLGFCDGMRLVSDDSLFSFWDYQAGAWQKNNGIRIDHILLSPEAVDRLHGLLIQKELRGREKPSDHVPVWLDIDLEFA